MITGSGSFRLFRIAGIEVFLHWSWFIVAVFDINNRRDSYSSLAWNAAEYVALFVIVLLHEFGHALACRQVGGQANRIILWPLGGVAFVAPPPRPGATLWAIAAGPLVNLVLTAGSLGARRREPMDGLGGCVPGCATFPLDPGITSTSACWFSTCCRSIPSTAGKFSNACFGFGWVAPAA